MTAPPDWPTILENLADATQANATAANALIADDAAKTAALTAAQAQNAAYVVQVASLNAEIALLESEIPLEFGMFNSLPDQTDASFTKLAVPSAMGRVVRRREFASSLVNWASHPCSKDAAAGLLSFASWKPSPYSPQDVAAGKADAAIVAAVTGAPDGTVITMWHEPEDDMAAAEWAAMEARFIKVALGVNPKLRPEYVAMEYQWGAHGNGNAKGYAALDLASLGLTGVAIDVYGNYTNVGATAPTTPIQNMSGFSAWLTAAQKWGLPMSAAEFAVMRSMTDKNGAVHTYKDADRGTWLLASVREMRSLGFKRISAWNADSQASDTTAQWSIAGGIASPMTQGAWMTGQTA